MGLNLREKERLAENKFKEWLNEKEIPFWYIHQEPDTFSNVFRKENVKRPDFIILIPNIGFILTDVEYKEPARKYPEFQIDVEETLKYCKIQEKYKLNIWYVFSNAINHFSTWYWIPVSKVKEIGEERKYRGYYGIPIEEFIIISKTQGINKLFAEMDRFFR